jgi:predicted GH43/DUF377 family glycosyl hydrolase
MDTAETGKKLVVSRQSLMLESGNRVITRPHIPGSKEHAKHIIGRVLSLNDAEVQSALKRVYRDFAHRHRNFEKVLFQNYGLTEEYLKNPETLSRERRLLLGAFLTSEYAIESAALFNPSIVFHPNQEHVPEGGIRFIMSFRATGEGHISSIVFRSGIIEENSEFYFDPISAYIETPEIRPDLKYDTHLFGLKLVEMGACNNVTNWILSELGERFTFDMLKNRIAELNHNTDFPEKDRNEAIEFAFWLANSNYEVTFSGKQRISERVIFPVSAAETKGIEDARFVRFVDDCGDVIYYATYTAYNGETIMPQIIKTRDFVIFKVITLNGRAVQNKGMALFPRKINGRYAMLSRNDGENNYIMFSENLHFWQEAELLEEPAHTWEFVQVGNCGSPIETPAGWLALTHGVGPMRKYSIGAMLLDLENPRKIIGRTKKPLLAPNEYEREGYVPNVVYTCGALLNGDTLIVPYAMGDQRCGIATVPLDALLAEISGR